MADIVLFTPKSEWDASENLNDFVAMCREQLTVFGADLCFDENVWDITDAIELKGRGNKRFRVVFSNLSTANDATVRPMAEPFLSFAKADFRYSFAMRPTKSPDRRMVALRALEEALAENGNYPDPVRMTAETFNRAAQLVKERFSMSSAYRVGGQLELLSKFLSDNHLVAVRIDWRNPLRRPTDTSRVGKEFDERRNKKLPSAAALEAIPKIFQTATEPSIVFASAIAATLCSAPDRINEILLLPANCEVREKKGDGTEAYGLRWWSAKGAEPMVKWVVPSMAEVVSEAIRRIRDLSANARKVAVWYEEHPNEAYLSEAAEHLRHQEWLSASELNLVLFGDETVPRQSGTQWCKLKKVTLIKRGRASYAKFADVEAALLELLPKGFPWLSKSVGLKYRDALCIVRENELHFDANIQVGRIAAVTIDQIHVWLGGATEKWSIFSRSDFWEPDGSAIKITSHQFRHYLNTLAQAGGMSQLDIAKWSGRRDIRQNAAYDHVSADELVLKIRNALGDDRQMFGPLAELPKRIVIHRDEFARLKVPTAHTTEFGVCIHDYTMAPCQLHADCLNCHEQVCIKGDEVRAARIRAELDTARESLAAAEQAQGDGYFGASRWVAHHRLGVERLTQLCEILDDPKVPMGAVIQLSNIQTASRIEQAAEARAGLGHEEGSSDESVTPSQAMRNLLTMMENSDA
ncbi:integrase [Cupriavidus necator N-1]|uniref:Integrase n=1 Tax=Cupriavidus necator (strain ATCC 43291 / DSM 13513 / CCUG 52238 / LMG 8453 / N-1) TaxID=1042878 RepID=G0EUS4_CUPNN|nr:integrase [Cupriavidus necator]AEI75785.1 integrase [Cupriavidus necator N-1]MDX6012075.1 integrase [Cupriavidus necator]